MDKTLIEFDYVNYKGEQETRHARPIKIWFGSTAYHPDAQWLMEAFDIDRCQTRDFAVSNILGGWRPYRGGKHVLPQPQPAGSDSTGQAAGSDQTTCNGTAKWEKKESGEEKALASLTASGGDDGGPKAD